MQHGELGDCHFLLSLIALIEQSDLVRGIFAEPMENDLGPVDMNIYRMGEQKSIILDRRVLFKNSKPKFMRSVSATESSWFCIAEKVFAKAAGLYSSIISGKQSVGGATR
jgi:hypothetical protein